jgi:hypothetical protein
MSWRLVRLGVVLSAGLLTGSCASTGNNFIADNRPAWAGGLPPGTPPREGAPGYNEYLKSVGVEPSTTASASPVHTEQAPPPPASSRKPPEAVDEPIH